MKSKKIQIEYKHFTKDDELPKHISEIIEKSKEAVQNAYAPYSKFKVGAAVRLASGKIVLGNNQENIAYPSGICAERVALFSAGALYPTEKVIQLAIASEGDFIDEKALLSPCGACRQVMAEVIKRQGCSFELIILNPDNSVLLFNKAEDLMPLLFGHE